MYEFEAIDVTEEDFLENVSLLETEFAALSTPNPSKDQSAEEKRKSNTLLGRSIFKKAKLGEMNSKTKAIKSTDEPPNNMSSNGELIDKSPTEPVKSKTGDWCVFPSTSGHIPVSTNNLNSTGWMYPLGAGASNSKSDNRMVTKRDMTYSPVRPTQLVRRFPGPAGLLPVEEDGPSKAQMQFANNMEKGPNLCPDQEADNSNLDLASFDANGKEKVPMQKVCECTMESNIETPWQKLSIDFKLFTDPESPLLKFTVAWVKRQAASHQLINKKVPFLAGTFKVVDLLNTDAFVVLEDHTGVITGTIHHEIWEALEGKLKPGTAIALRHVGVVNTGATSRRPHLNITLKNILLFYYCQENHGVREVNVLNVQNIKLNQLYDNVTHASSTPTMSVYTDAVVPRGGQIDPFSVAPFVPTVIKIPKPFGGGLALPNNVSDIGTKSRLGLESFRGNESKGNKLIPPFIPQVGIPEPFKRAVVVSNEVRLQKGPIVSPIVPFVPTFVMPEPFPAPKKFSTDEVPGLDMTRSNNITRPVHNASAPKRPIAPFKSDFVPKKPRFTQPYMGVEEKASEPAKESDVGKHDVILTDEKILEGVDVSCLFEDF